MNIIEIINNKRLKKVLSKEQLEFVVKSYTKGEIQDYQMSALLMAICNNGLNKDETYFLTKAMQNSGKTIDLSIFEGKAVDKHSTGGVSDTTTLIVAPILAESGLYMLKSSGRGLGHTGGTADKLCAFEGYSTQISFEKALKLTSKNGACLISQSLNLCPADKKMYALRDVTGTVESIELIASSIMSKKLASGNDIIVLDVKYGNGAFMESIKDAKKLAKCMVDIGKKDGKKVVAILTDMNQPLGYSIGDNLEVSEAIKVLQGEDNNLAKVSKFLASKIIELGKNIPFKQAMKQVEEIISTKRALEKFKEMVKDSGGKLELFNGYEPKPCYEIYAKQSGYIKAYKTKELGFLSCEIGCGRKKLDDEINHSAGIMTYFKIGDKVKNGDKLFSVYGDKKLAKKILTKLESCVIINKFKTKRKKLIKQIIE